MAFNFNKIGRDELLFEIGYKGNHSVSFIVNSSPLTPAHCLVCPDLRDNKSQVLTSEAIEFALDLLKKLGRRRFRIGFNSPGALASVNHLHLHLVDVPESLFVEECVRK